MRDIVFESSEKVNGLVEKFAELPVETQRLLFNYAYYSRERRGWFDALNVIEIGTGVNDLNTHFRTAFEIANFEKKCSRYGIASRLSIRINGEEKKFDFAIWDIQTFEKVNKAPRLILVSTGFVIEFFALDYQADAGNVFRRISDCMAADIWNTPYDIMTDILDYADEFLGV